jgi:hypothetical protein
MLPLEVSWAGMSPLGVSWAGMSPLGVSWLRMIASAAKERIGHPYKDPRSR